MNSKSLIYSLSAVLLWSTVATAFKLTLSGMNYIQLVFYSSAFSTIIFLILAVNESRGKFLNELSVNLKKGIVIGFINPFLYYIVLFKAYSLLPAHETQPLNYTWPLVASLMAVIFLKEKINWRIIAGLISAFIGVVLIGTQGRIFDLHFQNIAGVLLSLLSAFIWASYWIINLLDQNTNSAKLFIGFFAGSILSAIYIILFDSFLLSDYNFLWGAFYIGAFEMGITFLFWLRGLNLSSSKSKTAALAYLSPFISLIFINIFLGERIPSAAIFGLLFIVGGILFQQIRSGTNKTIQFPEI